MRGAPGTDPGVRNYRTRLLPSVMTARRWSGYVPASCLPYPLQCRLQGRPALCPVPGASKRIALGRRLLPAPPRRLNGLPTDSASRNDSPALRRNMLPKQPGSMAPHKTRFDHATGLKSRHSATARQRESLMSPESPGGATGSATSCGFTRRGSRTCDATDPQLTWQQRQQRLKQPSQPRAYWMADRGHRWLQGRK